MTMVYYSKKDRKHNHQGAKVHKTKAGGNQMPVFKSAPSGVVQDVLNPPAMSCDREAHHMGTLCMFQNPRFLEKRQVLSIHSCLYKQSRHSEPLSSGTGGNAPEPSSQCRPRAPCPWASLRHGLRPFLHRPLGQ